MGKKYIIELEDKPFHKEDGDFLYRAKGFNSIVFDMTGIGKLTPYTEPDLEQVRKEAYERGWKEATEEIGSDEQAIADKAYKKGLSDAWEAVRKIIHMPEGDLLNIFTECYSAVCTALQVILKYDAPEAIEKIRQYEQKKETEIKVGDEVIPRETEYDTMIVTRLWKDDYDSDCIDAIGFDGKICSFLVSRVSKTGKHYGIATILENMREDGDQNRIQENMSDDY